MRSRQIVERWCKQKGPGWSVCDQLGEGGTAPVFEIASPDGPRALKVYDAAFSAGQKGEIELKRIEQQVALRGHDCPSLVQVYEGGTFEDRLYLLMSRAPGEELGKRLPDVPRNNIRHIIDQVARAALFLRDNDRCHRDIKAANVFVSDDFTQVTLLDISVIREIHDPIGVGTDQDGQLPIVATARYSPPEYLFRLLEPGPELWHALTVYQLGGLLHDLIMRQPLFHSEHLACATNRYRFAWIVATMIPNVQADDVDQDLVLTARRALDKDWKRRSALALEDFLADAKVQQTRSLDFLGLASERGILIQDHEVSFRLQRILAIARALEQAVADRLRKQGATAEHSVSPGADDSSKLLSFRWPPPSGRVHMMSDFICLELQLKVEIRFQKYYFRSSARLRAPINHELREATMDLPDVEDQPGVESLLASQVVSMLGPLAVELTRTQHPVSGDG